MIIVRKLFFSLDAAFRSIPNQFGNTVWLKLQRKEHSLTAYYSGNGKTWISLGEPINAVNLDKAQPDFNSWVGTSVGVFAESKPADFDFFTCKDGFSPLSAVGYANYYGVKIVKNEAEKVVTNTSSNGGWFMISGVETGKKSASAIEVTASAVTAGKLEIWLDGLKDGKLIATIPVSSTGGENNWKAFTQTVKNVTGHHDIFIKFSTGNEEKLFIKTIRFVKQSIGQYSFNQKSDPIIKGK